MNQHSRYFLTILAAALRGQKARLPEPLSEADWQPILQLASVHNVLPLIYEAASHLLPPQRGTLPDIRKQVRYQVMLQTRKTSEFLALNRHLRAAGIRPLVVKGIVCRELYPQPDHRRSTDEDLLIPEELLDACHGALLSFGMRPADPEADRTSAYEIPYVKPDGVLYIELHKHLFPPESAAYGDLNRFFEEVFRRAREEEIQGEPVLTMAPTDHLFYLICHAFKHFLHSGFGIRQVCDLVLFAERYGSGIYWTQVLESCRRIRAERFAAAMFRIGEIHLGFDPEAARYPACWREIPVDEMPMLEDLLQSGIYGGAELSRKHSSTITLTAVADQKQGSRERSGLMESLFPPAKAMEKRYPYLKKHPYLLPVAWGSRIVKYGRETKSTRNNHAADAVKIGAQRVALLRQYGILE